MTKGMRSSILSAHLIGLSFSASSKLYRRDGLFELG